MAKRQIEYGRLVEQALRTVVRDVLARVAREGLAGTHHFFVTFRTGDPGVEMADFLRDRYPGEMTIVLQYQFWGLEVDQDGFAVTLSFNNAPERLRVPFTAIKVFADPASEFGLQFTIEPETRIVALPTLAAPAAVTAAAPSPGIAAAAAPDGAVPDGGGGDGRQGAEIVALDRFRKK